MAVLILILEHELAVRRSLSLSIIERSTLGVVEFDKDDAWAMRFVTAAANLRARVFGIPPQVFFIPMYVPEAT